jgi:cytochrome c553
LLGFIVMPVVQGRAAGIDAFTAICRVVGVLPGSPARPTPSYQATAQPVRHVAWTAATFETLYRADRANVGGIAEERCVSCHTLEGNTPDPTIPRNIGQSVFALYKQLQDFRSGAHVNEIMSLLVKDLDDKQIADLAAYYGRLFRVAIDPAESGRYMSGSISRTSSPTVMSPAVCHRARPVTRRAPAARSRPRP